MATSSVSTQPWLELAFAVLKRLLHCSLARVLCVRVWWQCCYAVMVLPLSGLLFACGRRQLFTFLCGFVACSACLLTTLLPLYGSDVATLVLPQLDTSPLLSHSPDPP